MTSRKFTLINDGRSHDPRSTTSFGPSVAWGAIGPGSRAERLHRGRPAINRSRHHHHHHHHLHPQDERLADDERRHQENQMDEGGGGRRGGGGRGGGGSEEAGETTSSSWTSGHQNRDSKSPFVTDGRDSTNSGDVVTENEEWQPLKAVTSTKSIRENEATVSVEQRTVKQVVEPDDLKIAGDSSRAPAASCHQNLHFFDQWLPVTVIRCHREPASTKGTSSRETRSPAPRQEPNSTGQRDERSYTHEETTIKDREHRQSSIYESSSARTIVQQKDSARKLSRSTNSLLSSADWNDNSDIGRSYSFGKCLSDSFRISLSDPWESEAFGQLSSTFSTTKHGSNCHRAETHTFYSPVSSSSSGGGNTIASVATQLGPRPGHHGGRNYYGESNPRIRTKSMHGDNAKDTPRPTAVMHRSEETMTSSAKAEKELLGKVGLQTEPDNQRLTWQPEIDRSLGITMATDDLGQTNSGRMTSFEAASNGYVDTSSAPVPMFRATVDVKEFPPEAISVRFDRYTNEVIVQVKGRCCCCCEGEEAKRKTTAAAEQRIRLPRYADDSQLMARIDGDGTLGIEVPLVYYFPEEEESKDIGSIRL